MKTQSVTIGALSVLAAVLLTVLIVLPGKPQPAYGDVVNSGDFTLITWQATGESLLAVIDTRQQSMLVYRLTSATANARFEAVGKGDLARGFAPATKRN